MKYLLTGCTSGIGLKIAIDLMQRGDHVHGLGCRRISLRSELPEELRTNKNFSFSAVDLRHLNELEGSLKDLKREFSGVVLCAGATNQYKKFDEISTEEALDILKVNFVANTLIIKNMKNILYDLGSVIIISSNTLTLGGSPFNAIYSASKSALETYAIAAQKSFFENKIRVNIIRPGLINSGMNKKVSGYSEERYKQRVKMVPVGRAGETQDVSNMVQYLLDDKSQYIFGQTISISGGE
jgi:3-oxoacyl-[acyl-carrier protein] reductase